MSNGSRAERRWPARATLAVLALTAVATVSLPEASGAADPHRAAIVVETGTSTHRVVVTFSADSITGVEALRRAGADPVIYAFAGQGGAVCRLFGVGRDADANCLGGQDGDARYWAYFRAAAGTSSFEYSQAGAGATQVRDGDVEGWRFGTGQAPTYVSLASLLPPTSPPPPPSEPPGGVVSEPLLGGLGNRSAADGTPPAATDGLPGAGASANRTPSTLPDTGATGADGQARAVTETGDGSGAARAGGRDGDARRAANTETELAVSSTDDDGGSSALSLLWFALLIVAIAVAIFVVRRARRANVPAP